jgi:hypothetical protein
MLTLFPDAPDAALLHRITPWWCTLHYLMQASTVLLLELSFRAQHVPEKATMVSKAANKAIDWLSTLSKMNNASEKAWKLCDGFLRRLTPHVGIEASEISENDESSEGSLLDELAMDEPDVTEPDIAELNAMPTDQAVDDFTFGASEILPINAAEMNNIAAEMDPIPCSPMEQSAKSPPGMLVPCSFDHADMLDPFVKEEMSSFDDYFPYDPATGQITGSFFPTGPNVDLDLGYFYGDAVY